MQHLFVGGRELVDATSIAASGLSHDAELTLVVDAADATTSSTMTLADRPRNFTLKTLTGKSVALTLSKVKQDDNVSVCASLVIAMCHLFQTGTIRELKNKVQDKEGIPRKTALIATSRQRETSVLSVQRINNDSFLPVDSSTTTTQPSSACPVSQMTRDFTLRACAASAI